MSRTVVVIGAGFNGLVAATKLATQGWNVVLLERRAEVGGAASNIRVSETVEYSGGANWLGMTHPDVKGLLREPFSKVSTVLADPFVSIGRDGKLLSLWANNDQKNLRNLSDLYGDRGEEAAVALAKYAQSSSAIGTILRQWYRRADFDTSALQASLAVAVGEKLARAVMSGSLLDLTQDLEQFQLLRAAALSAGISASNALPGKSGSGITGAHMSIAEFQKGHMGSWGLISGGMGQLMESVRLFAQSQKVDVRVGESVIAICDRGDDVEVQSTSGRYITDFVLFSGHPETLSKIVDQSERHILSSYCDDKQDYGTSAVGIIELSNIPAVVNDHNLKQGMFCICPDLDYIEQAWRDFQRDGLAEQPILTFSFDDMARGAACVLYVYCQFCSYSSDDDCNLKLRRRLSEVVLKRLVGVMPDLGIVGDRWLTPRDLEVSLGLVRGHPEHFGSCIGRHFEYRRAPDIHGGKVLLCGASVFPGGNLTGLPGLLAAERLIKQSSSIV